MRALRSLLLALGCGPAILSASLAQAGSYAYHPASVLKLGGTFSPENLTVAYPSCLRYAREYVMHRLGRKEVQEDEQPLPSDQKGAALLLADKAAKNAEIQAADLRARAENITSNTDLSIEQIKTREHLYSFLNVSASISGQYKLFSASASMSYESEETFDADSFTFGVRGLSTWGEIGLINPRLSGDAARLTGNRAAFYARCGREWVASETRGVLIAVIYTIKNVSQSQRSRLEAAVSGGFGGSVLKLNVESKLSKILESAFVSNYYSTRIHAIGGEGVSSFSQTINDLDDPVKVLKQISDYMKDLIYQQSVPLSFSTGPLDQFLVSDQDGLLFDSYNRRISDLFLAYEEYRSRRQSVWRFVNDDTQASWGNTLDDPAWTQLALYDATVAKIEQTAKFCRNSARAASSLVSRGENVARRLGRPRAPNSDNRARSFMRDFSLGMAPAVLSDDGREERAAAAANAPAVEPACRRSTGSDLEEAAYSLCECLRPDPSLYVRARFPILSTPAVKVVHETEALKPGSLLYISVNSSAGLQKVELFDNQDALALTLAGGFDPDSGPVWSGSIVYRDAQGIPPAAQKLPYVLRIEDNLHRVYRKPVVVQD